MVSMVEIRGMLLRRRPFRMLYIVVGFWDWGLRYGCVVNQFVMWRTLWERWSFAGGSGLLQRLGCGV
jgi:hypothetical protein